MFMDSSMATFKKNDGIATLMHCQERNFRTENELWDFSLRK